MVGEEVGTVEKIGVRTTRLRSLSGEQIIFPNADLLGGRIRNFKSLQERRVLFTIGVVYGTPNDKLAAIPDMIRQIIESQDMTRFDRAHFKAFGDSALQFENRSTTFSARSTPSSWTSSKPSIWKSIGASSSKASSSPTRHKRSS